MRKNIVSIAVLMIVCVIMSAALSSCEAIVDALTSAVEELSKASDGSQSAGISAEESSAPVSVPEEETSEESEEDTSEYAEVSENEDISYPEDESEEEFEDESEEEPYSVPAPVSEPEPEPSIPFGSEPVIPDYVLPAESFSDDLERKASEIIDRAISRAIAVVSVYKDDRHSNVSYKFDYDANGFVKELSSKQKGLYDKLIKWAEGFEVFELKQSEYGGDVLVDTLTVAKPLQLTRPDIDSYFSFKPGGNLSSIKSSYFDPYKDGNYTVEDGEVKLSDVKYAAALLQRIIERVVRKMPAGLSTYDKYLYLATVVSEQNSYDNAPDNCFTPFGALVCGRSVCEGYTRAFLLLCREADLWCAYRFGVPKGGGHIWNMIKLDTGIYNVDVTWSDNYETGSKKWFRFFVRSDADFVADGHNANDGVKGTGKFEPNPFENSK